MKRMTVLVLVLSLFAAPLIARAEEAQPLTYPASLRADNPYAAGLEQAKQAFDAALAAYRAAAPHAYESWAAYSTYVRAYYAVWNAYSRYTWYLQAYDWAERQQTFSGRVIAAGTRYPVAGATVHLMTYVPAGSTRPIALLGTRTTDADGGFRFDRLASGTYTYTVESPGFAGVRRDLDLRPGAGFQTIELRRASPISGQVTARTRFVAASMARPLANVKVSLFRSDVVYIRAPDANAIVTTDADGRFAFASAEFATARVIFEAPNYQTVTRDVTLGAGPVNLDVVMEWNGPVPVPVAREATFDDLNRR